MTEPETENRAFQGARASASQGVHQEAFTLLRAHAPAKGRVLDIPCGSGAFLQQLLEAGYDATGADIAPHAAVPDAYFQQADMNAPLPFADATFDAVASIEGIEHIQRPFDFVRECRRVLKPGGVLLLTTPNISSLRSRWRWLLTGFHNKAKYPLDESDPQPRHHINMMSFPELRYLMHTQGLQIETVTTNRVKGASLLYMPWAPVARCVSGMGYKRAAKSPAHLAVCRDLHAQLYSRPVMYGETLILLARAV